MQYNYLSLNLFLRWEGVGPRGQPIPAYSVNDLGDLRLLGGQHLKGTVSPSGQCLTLQSQVATPQYPYLLIFQPNINNALRLEPRI